jgi:hypothetical protein
MPLTRTVLPPLQYMDPADFNKTEEWCPRLYGAAPDSPCVYPTIRHLLNMGSGLLDIDNCGYPEGAWQRKYCSTHEKVGGAGGRVAEGAPLSAAAEVAHHSWGWSGGGGEDCTGEERGSVLLACMPPKQAWLWEGPPLSLVQLTRGAHCRDEGAPPACAG